MSAAGAGSPRRQGYRGMAHREPPVSAPAPENGLASVYLSPNHLSSVIHLVHDNPHFTILCMPNIPAGRMVGRPEADEPTCGRCLNIHNQKEAKRESLAAKHKGKPNG